MNLLLEKLAELLPGLTHPLSLVAFVVFVGFFLVVKLLLGANLLKPLTQSHGFRILNKILNIAAVVVLLVILLAFAAYYYDQYLRSAELREGLSDSFRQSSAEDLLGEIVQVIDALGEEAVTARPLERLKLFQPPIYQLGKTLSPKDAFDRIMELRDRYPIDELTPALLPVSSWMLASLFDEPFNYSTRCETDLYHTSHYSCLDDPREIGHLSFLASQDVPFPYREIVDFLAGSFPAVVEADPRGRFADAAQYCEIREAIGDGRYTDAVVAARAFEQAFPDHPHLDDSFALKVIALELGNRPREAMQAAAVGRLKPDGDMSYWFDHELMLISEIHMDTTTLRSFLEEDLDELEVENGSVLDRTELLYTLAQHEMAEGHLYSARDRFLALGSSEQAPSLDLGIELMKLDSLADVAGDQSAEGAFQRGLLFYRVDLMFYNRMVYRRSRRAAEGYFELRNNFFRAAREFERAESLAQDQSLRQRTLYKLAKSYFHLSHPNAFFLTTIGGRSRTDYLRLARDTFARCHELIPDGDLSDDCLAEVAWLWMIQDDEESRSRAIETFEQVLLRFPERNAADNALYWLGRTYEQDGDLARALNVYTRLAAGFGAERWAEIGTAAVRRVKGRER